MCFITSMAVRSGSQIIPSRCSSIWNAAFGVPRVRFSNYLSVRGKYNQSPREQPFAVRMTARPPARHFPGLWFTVGASPRRPMRGGAARANQQANCGISSPLWLLSAASLFYSVKACAVSTGGKGRQLLSVRGGAEACIKEIARAAHA